MTAGANVVEPLMGGGVRSVATMRRRASELLERVEIDLRRLDDPVNALSGGMRQASPARASVRKPRGSPNPLRAHDRARRLSPGASARLIRELQRDTGVATIFISHDLSVLRLLADGTMIMRWGRVIEAGLTDQILEDPQKWYTQLLVSSMP